MANNKKLVEAITSMEDDFAQWYTDVVKKAELCGYTSVKGCMAIKPAGKISSTNWTEDLKRLAYRTCTCQSLFRNLFFRKRKIM